MALVTSVPGGGPVELALVLARALGTAGCRVRAVCATDEVAGRFAAAGADPVVAPLRPGGDVAGALRLRRALAGCDAVHSHDRRAGLWTRALPRPGGAALVHTVHGLPDAYLPPPAGPPRPGARDVVAYRGLEAALARRGRVTTPSQGVAAVLVRRLGVPPARLTVIPNAVEAVAEPGARGDAVGTLSRLEPVKGLDVFIDAAARLHRDRPGLPFTVSGDGSLAAALPARAAALGVPVRFPGHVPSRQALDGLAVLAVPSHHENAPMAVLEAMAAGVPVVASAVGGLPEIAPAGTARLVPPGDAAALAAAIADLLDDPAAARAQADAAAAHVRAHARPETLAARTMAVYAAARP